MSMRTLSSLLGWSRKIVDGLASAIVLGTTVVIGVTLMAGVVVRYVMSGSLSWSAELPVVLFPWLIMAGIVMAAVRHEHLGVDYVVRKLPEGVSRGIAIAMQLLIMVTMATLVVQSQAILQFLQYQTTPVLGWSAVWAFYSLPAGAAGVLIISLIHAIELCVPRSKAERAGERDASQNGSEETMS